MGGPVSVPYGWADFCRRYAGECDGGPLAPLDVNLTPQAMKEIERVDKWVNAHVKPVSDIEHWGVIDQWDYPADGKGDCEDYALFKRKILIGEGFPRQALLMTGQGRTQRGPCDPYRQDQCRRVRPRQFE